MSQQLQPGEHVTTLMSTGDTFAYRIDGVEIEQVEPRRGLVLGVAVLILNKSGVGGSVHVLKPHEVNRLV